MSASSVGVGGAVPGMALEQVAARARCTNGKRCASGSARSSARSTAASAARGSPSRSRASGLDEQRLDDGQSRGAGPSRPARGQGRRPPPCGRVPRRGGRRRRRVRASARSRCSSEQLGQRRASVRRLAQPQQRLHQALAHLAARACCAGEQRLSRSAARNAASASLEPALAGREHPPRALHQEPVRGLVPGARTALARSSQRSASSNGLATRQQPPHRQRDATIWSAANPCASAERDRLHAPLACQRERSAAVGPPPGGQAADLDVRAADPPRQREALLQVPPGVVEPARPQLDDAEIHQRRCADVVAERDLARADSVRERRLERTASRRARRRGRRAGARARAAGRQTDLEATPPLVGHRPVRAARRRRGTRAASSSDPGQLDRPAKTGASSGSRPPPRPGTRPAARRSSLLAVEREAGAVVDEQAGGLRPVPGGLGVPDRLDDVPVLGEPARRRRGAAVRSASGLGPAQLEPQQVGEEVVVAEPGPPGVERDDERVRRLELAAGSAPSRRRR